MRTLVGVLLAALTFACATPNGHAAAASGAATAGPPTAGEKLIAKESGLAALSYDPALDRFLGCAAAGKRIDCLQEPATVRRGGEIEMLRALEAAAPDQKAALLVQSVHAIGGPITPVQPACARKVIAKVRLLARRGRCALVKDRQETRTIRVPDLTTEGVADMAKQKLTGTYRSEVVSLVTASPPASASRTSTRILCEAGTGRLRLDVDAYDGAYAYATVRTHYAGDGPDGKAIYRCVGTKGVDLSTPKTLPKPAPLTEDARLRLLARLSPYRVLGGKRAAELFACAAKGASPSCLPFEDDYYEVRLPQLEGVPAAQLAPMAGEVLHVPHVDDEACARPAYALAAKAAAKGMCVVAKKPRSHHHYALDAADRARIAAAVTGKMAAWANGAPASVDISQYDATCSAGKAQVHLRLIMAGTGSGRRLVDATFKGATLADGKHPCD